MSELSADIIRIHREQWEQNNLPEALRGESIEVQHKYMVSAYKRELKEEALKSIRRGLHD